MELYYLRRARVCVCVNSVCVCVCVCVCVSVNNIYVIKFQQMTYSHCLHIYK